MDFFLWVLSSAAIVSFGEGLNCVYPYHDGEHDNIGIICQWESNTFYYDVDEEEWILKKEGFNDNIIEAMSRKRYWEKRYKMKEQLLENEVGV